MKKSNFLNCDQNALLEYANDWCVFKKKYIARFYGMTVRGTLFENEFI